MGSAKSLPRALIRLAAVLLTTLFLSPAVLAAPAMKPALAPAAKAAPAASPMTPAAADVIVKRIDIIPAQPVAGESFEVHVVLFNQGKGSTGPGQQCVLGIEPGGGPAGPFPVPAIIAPGQSYDFVKKYVFMQAGNYVALARPIPGPSDATIKTFVVAAKLTGVTAPTAGGQAATGSKLLTPAQTGAAKVAPQPLKPALMPPGAAAPPSAQPSGAPPSLSPTSLSQPKLTKGTEPAAIKAPVAAGVVAATPKHIPFTKLQVQTQGIDSSMNFGERWQSDLVMPLDFRWSTNTEQTAGNWEVAVNPQFNQIIASGSAGTAPAEGLAQMFNIDFRYLDLPVIPATLYVRVKPYKTQSNGSPVYTNPSAPVQVVFTGTQQGSTVFVLPALKVLIQRIDVIDDGDDLDAGEFRFRFTLEGVPFHQFYGADISSGDSAAVNIAFRLESPPQYVYLHAKGCEYDVDFYSSDCEGCDEWAAGKTMLTTGAGQGAMVKPQTPFQIYAHSGDVEFWVHGVYWVE